MRTVLDDLKRWVGTSPDKVVYTYRNVRGEITESATFRQLERRTNGMAANLARDAGIRHDQVVLLACHPGLVVIEALLACAKIGAIAVPVPPVGLSSGAAGVERLAAVARDSGASVVLADGRQFEAAEMIRAKGIGGHAGSLNSLQWINLASLAGEQAEFAAVPHELLFLQYTSGSTRQPRGVMVSHANVLANSPADAGTDMICVSWLPHYHDMGLIGYFLFPLLFGGSSHILSTADFMRRPALWLETISSVRATNSSAPDFAFAYCLRTDKIGDDALAALDLSSLRDMMNASEPVRPATMRAFAERFGRCGLDPAALTVAYGLAENTLRVSIGGRVHLALNKERLAHREIRLSHGCEMAANVAEIAGCGAPVAGVDVRIVDPDSLTECPPDTPGEIWVAGAGKAGGYWRQPDLSRSVFAARLASGEGEFLRTGDIGFFRDGEIFVCGRLRDMVVLRGRNIFPADVEGAIEARFPAIEPGRVAAFGSAGDQLGQQGLTILVEARKGAEAPLLDEILRFAVNAFQVPVDEVAMVRRGAIVKTSSGKISRSRCQADYLAGLIETVARYVAEPNVNEHETVEDYLDALLERAGAASAAETTIGDLGLDSVELVELSIRLEDLAEASGLDDRNQLVTLHDMRLLQAASIAEIKAMMAGLAAGAVSAEAIAGSLGEAVRGLASEEAERMREDARLDPRWVPGTGEAGLARTGRLTVVTGASGFLGSYLLAALLRQTDDRLAVIVRAQNASHGQARLHSALVRTGMRPGEAEAYLRRRVDVLCGDIGAPSFGLDTVHWEHLAREASRVFHCAAEVDYRKTYGELRAVNVEGTREAVRLCFEGRAKELNHVSTTFIFGWTNWKTKAEHMRNEAMSGLNFGYAQSKWVAEQLVFAAMDRGLAARVFRPSLVSASPSGHFLRGDVTSRLFGYFIRHGVFASSEKQLSLLPVEVCGENIAAIAGLADSVGRAFHLTADNFNTVGDVCAIIARKFGYRLDDLDVDGFVDHVNENCERDDDLFPLKSFINANREKLKDVAFERYDNADYRAFRAKTKASISEPPLEETVTRLVRFLKANGLVPAAPRRGSDVEEMTADVA